MATGSLAALAELARAGQMGPMLRLGSLVRAHYRLCFAASAARSGVLSALTAGPRTAAEIAQAIGLGPADAEPLAAWLDLGVRIGELDRGAGRYRLRGRFCRDLAREANAPVAALAEEVAELHTQLLLETPARLAAGRRFALAEQRGELVARSSTTLGPFVRAAIDAALPHKGAVRLLEIGCGTGIHVLYAARRNPELTACALELQTEVAELARANLRGWGLERRVEVECADVREKPASPDFDLVTLHNNIYYFPINERPALLRHVRGFLRPGGALLVTTGCRGGSALMELLNLWGAMTEGCGPLSEPGEIEQQLRGAGFERVERRSLIPREAFFAFTAR